MPGVREKCEYGQEHRPGNRAMRNPPFPAAARSTDSLAHNRRTTAENAP